MNDTLLKCKQELFDYLNKLKLFLSQIDTLEKNTQLSDNEKLSQLKLIKDEMQIIKQQIDRVKLEIKICTDVNIN